MGEDLLLSRVSQCEVHPPRRRVLSHLGTGLRWGCEVGGSRIALPKQRCSVPFLSPLRYVKSLHRAGEQDTGPTGGSCLSAVAAGGRGLYPRVSKMA